jgi:transcriptional regulator with XRE-family HTH domain
MKIEPSLSDTAILLEIGERFKALRVQLSLTQNELASQAGVSIQSVKRLESGEIASRLSTFIAICRTLRIIERFDLLAPESTIQPVDLLKLQGKKRQRVRKGKHESPAVWKWGDEA